ncbi:glycosyltransferase family 4 protein [Belnapia rosea]|uniref:glycosyltransferase family 4 protein n=1 Tax=Belnapia rosea TaxID=938405 RepID=UPI000889CF73|nr:glycosyltransferase family 4 protein [Belnapia rosea]SDB63975.1 Glycosyltransferase involved in cell wall bisynthesis [Belnapia rosea]
MTGPVRRLRRLLVLLPSAGIGGAEMHTATLVRALAAAGVDITVAAEAGLREGLAPLFAPVAVEAAPVGWREAEGPAANAGRQSAAAAALLARLRPDAVLLPLPWPGHGLGLQAALATARTPGLAIIHLAPIEPEVLPSALVQPALAAPLTWVAVSAPVARRVEAVFGLARGRVTVVPNGVAVPPEDPARRLAERRARRTALGLGPDAPLVLFAGRLEDKKGAELLPALADHLRTVLGATLVALGEGPLMPRLAGHPAARPEGPLRLRGAVPDVADWLLAADALVLPSRLEGFPLVFLEAAARRCPVVATEAALECLGSLAKCFAWMSKSQSILDLTLHFSVIFKDIEAAGSRVEAAHAYAEQYGVDWMLDRYFVQLRGGLIGDVPVRDS